MHIGQTKTILFAQSALSVLLPVVSGSVVCPVAALIKHLQLNQVPASASLFLVRVQNSASFQPITYLQFSPFLAQSLQAVGADPSSFSPHSFRRWWKDSFAFDCGIPAELIKLQDDWPSDAY